MTVIPQLTQSQHAMRESSTHKKLQVSLISMQAEKSLYRDQMLDEYVKQKEKKQPQTTEDFVKLKVWVTNITPEIFIIGSE